MKKITKLLSTAMVLLATIGFTANAQLCNDFGQNTSDNSRGWDATAFTTVGATTKIDVKVDGSATIKAGDLYRGIANSGNPISLFQNTETTIELKRGTASFNWLHFVAYADWNGDGTFDPVTEKLFFDGGNSNIDRSHTITVPADAKLGETHIRIIMGWFLQDTDETAKEYYSPCKIISDLGVEPKNARAFDFLVDIKPEGTAILPPSFSVANNSYIVKGESITMTSTDGTTIKYTTDGTEPATSTTATTSTSNTVSLPITAATTLKAVTVLGESTSDPNTINVSSLDIALGTYYYAVFQRPDATLALQDMGENLALQTQTLALGTEAQLWKVEKGSADGIYTLTSKVGNKVFWNGTRYAASNTASSDTEVRFLISSNATYPNSLEIQRTGSTTMAMNPFQGSFAGREIAEWNVGDGGNPIKFVTQKEPLMIAIQKAKDIYNNSKEGTDFGQFTAAARTDFKNAIDAAQGVYDNTTATLAEISAAIESIPAAIRAYGTTINKDLNSLISTTDGNYKWYWIRSTSTHAYANGKVISAGTRAMGSRYTYEDKVATMELMGVTTAAQLFRFELSTDKTSIVSIIDKFGNRMAANANIAPTSTEGNTFTLVQLSDAFSFNIKPTDPVNALHAQERNADLVNWAGDAGSASAWVLDFATETTAPTWCGDSFMTVGGAETGTWYTGSNSHVHTGGHFNEGNLGDFKDNLTLGGELQLHAATTETAIMYYKINDLEPVATYLPYKEVVGNNSKHYGESVIDLSALNDGEHTIAVWFKATRDVEVYDSNSSANYTATFTKTSTGIDKVTTSPYRIYVVDGVIQVVGTNDFEVYALTGQRQVSNSVLTPGIYLVKINQSIQKVIVR